MGDKFYIILRGKVSVQIYSKEKNTEKKEGKPVRTMIEVNELHAGDKFGELALIDNKPRKATIVCKEECDFATLDSKSYKELLGIVDLRLIDF
jgi:CRP-like cAMP-binding protein